MVKPHYFTSILIIFSPDLLKFNLPKIGSQVDLFAHKSAHIFMNWEKLVTIVKQ